MLFDKETRYWQEEYRKGNLDDEDMPGEIRAVLDGSAEKGFKWVFITIGIFALTMIMITIIL